MKRIILSALAVFSSNLIPSAAGFRIAGNTQTIEYTPELIASQDYLNNSVTFVSGGVPNLYSDSSIDIASNAETQALRQYNTNKDLRIIYTVCQVTYRIVANKASGISTLADLKGKRIGTTPDTSAAYFVEKYLATVGVSSSQYTTVFGSTCQAAPCGQGTFPYMLAHGSVDAVAMWEPTGELAAEALPSGQAVTFSNASVYREIFNLHATASKLNNTSERASIVSFLRALIKAEDVFLSSPSSVYSRVASAVGMNTTVLQNVWPYHNFNGTAGLPSDLLSVLVAEDQWVAQQDNRQAMSQSTLEGLIDASVLEDALKPAS